MTESSSRSSSAMMRRRVASDSARRDLRVGDILIIAAPVMLRRSVVDDCQNRPEPTSLRNRPGKMRIVGRCSAFIKWRKCFSSFSLARKDDAPTTVMLFESGGLISANLVAVKCRERRENRRRLRHCIGLRTPTSHCLSRTTERTGRRERGLKSGVRISV